MSSTHYKQIAIQRKTETPFTRLHQLSKILSLSQAHSSEKEKKGIAHALPLTASQENGMVLQNHLPAWSPKSAVRKQEKKRKILCCL